MANPQWIALLLSVIATIISLWSAGVWRRTLRSKRGDDAIGAAFDLCASLGAFKAAVERPVRRDIFGARVDHLYAQFSQMDKTYVIAQRSVPRKLKPPQSHAWLAAINDLRDNAVAFYQQEISSYTNTNAAEFEEAYRKAMGNAVSLRDKLLLAFPQ